MSDDIPTLELEVSGRTVGRIGREESIAFIARHHYAGRGGENTVNVGLYDDRLRLVGVAAFGVPVSLDAAASVFGPDHQARVMDLQRLVLDDDQPTNSESWFLARALDVLKSHRPDTWAVTTFADTTEGHRGTIYQALGAIYAGLSSGRTQYRDTDGTLRSDRHDGRKIGRDEALGRGWSLERRLAKHRYLLLTPDNRGHRRMLLRLLKWRSLPYPCGRSVVGDASSAQEEEPGSTPGVRSILPADEEVAS